MRSLITTDSEVHVLCMSLLSHYINNNRALYT